MATAGAKGGAPTGASAVTAEQHRAACAALRPDAMRDACRLLLGSLGGGGGTGNPDAAGGADGGGAPGEDAGTRLLEMYGRAKAAVRYQDFQ